MKSVNKTIEDILITDFRCSPEQLHLINRALEGYIPNEMNDFINEVKDFKPEDGYIPGAKIKFEQDQEIRFTTHPMNWLMEYLHSKYSSGFAMLYFMAITSGKKPAEYLKQLKWLNKVPFGDKIKESIQD